MTLCLICKVALGAPLDVPKLVLLSGTGATIVYSRQPEQSRVTDKETMLTGELNYYLQTDGQTDIAIYTRTATVGLKMIPYAMYRSISLIHEPLV